jgi:hypothetical protein
MTVAEFDDTLRKFIRSKPFMPFVVEQYDGQRIVVTEPTVAFDNGGGIYLSDSSIAIFYCEEIRAIRLESHGAVA